jgi:Fe-S-cluster containining protein
MSHELAYFSMTLKGAISGMSARAKAVAAECFTHWRGEWKRIGREEAMRVAFTEHELIDERIADMRQTTKHEVACAKGCAACCHVCIDAFPQEAELLIAAAKALDVEIDWARLEKQRRRTPATWNELDPADKRCVFLGDNRVCRVYEHRPSSCRKYLVKGDPDLCDMEKHPGGKVGIVFDVEAEVIHSAAFTTFGGGNLADMLLEHRTKNEGMIDDIDKNVSA